MVVVSGMIVVVMLVAVVSVLSLPTASIRLEQILLRTAVLVLLSMGRMLVAARVSKEVIALLGCFMSTSRVLRFTT